MAGWYDAFQAPPGSQASSRGEAKDSALLSSRDAGCPWDSPGKNTGVASLNLLKGKQGNGIENAEVGLPW